MPTQEQAVCFRVHIGDDRGLSGNYLTAEYAEYAEIALIPEGFKAGLFARPQRRRF